MRYRQDARRARPARGSEVVGIDRSHALFQAARLRLARSRPAAAIRFARADAGGLPLGEGRFDGVFAESVVAFQDELRVERILAEVARVLRPGDLSVLNEAIRRPGVTQHEASAAHAAGSHVCGSRIVLAVRRYWLGLRAEVRWVRRCYRVAGAEIRQHGERIEARLFVLRRASPAPGAGSA